MNNEYYIENANVDLSQLKNWELDLIEIFKEATRLTGEIYGSQIDPNTGFYPKGITIDKIEDAAVNDPTILSPYTRVVKDGSKLKAIFYYDEFSDQIDKIIKLLKDAAEIYSKNGIKKYSDYLKALASDLKSADFESSEKRWLKLDGTINVDIKLGPLETYQDKLLGIKRVFQSNLRIRNDVEYSNLKEYIDVINAILPMSPFAKDVSETDFVVRIDNVIAMGGWHAELIPTSSNYPADINYYKLGVKAMIYTNNIIIKQAVVNKIAKKLIDSSLNDEERLLQARIKNVIFHEIAETISKLKYPDSYNQLRNYRDLVIEAYATLMGVKSGAIHVLKGFLTTEDYQYVLVVFMANVFRGWMQGKLNASISTYSDGYKLAFNYFVETKAIRIYENKIQIDYARMYSAIDSLTAELSQIILDGDPQAAKKLFDKYSTEKVLGKFESILRDIIEPN